MYMLTFVIMHEWLILQKRPSKNKPEMISNDYPWYGNKKEETGMGLRLLSTAFLLFFFFFLVLTFGPCKTNVLHIQKIKVYHKD